MNKLAGLIAVAAQAGTTSAQEDQTSAKAPAPAKTKKICKTEEAETGAITRRRVCYTVPQTDSASKETRGQQSSDQAAQNGGGR